MKQKIEAAALDTPPQRNTVLPAVKSPPLLSGSIVADQGAVEVEMQQALSALTSKPELEYSSARKSEEVKQEVSPHLNIGKIARSESNESEESLSSLRHPDGAIADVSVALSPESAQLPSLPPLNFSIEISSIVDKISNLRGETLSDDFKEKMNQYLESLLPIIAGKDEEGKAIDATYLLLQADEVLNKISKVNANPESDLLQKHPAIFSGMIVCMAHKLIDDFSYTNNDLRQLFYISADDFNAHEVDILKMMGLIDFGKTDIHRRHTSTDVGTLAWTPRNT
jgi:hypothetical protein